MKFYHCADLHLGSPMDSRLPKEKAIERGRELLSVFSNIAETANSDGAAAVIVAGDLFDASEVSEKVKNFVFETAGRFPDVDFLILRGNHDEELADIEKVPSNVKFFDTGWTYFDYGNVTVCGAESCDASSLTLDGNRINIVVLHGADGSDFSLRDLKNKNIDYLALGHYHEYSCEKLDRRGVYCYSGCPEGRGFDEVSEKGYVVVETDEKTLSHRFVASSKRKILEVFADLSDADTLEKQRNAIIASLSDAAARDIVRVTVVGTYELGRNKYYENIVSDLEKDYFFIELKDKSSLFINPDDYINDISLRGEFIRLVTEKITDEEKRGKVISYGLRALKGDRPE